MKWTRLFSCHKWLVLSYEIKGNVIIMDKIIKYKIFSCRYKLIEKNNEIILAYTF